MKSIIYFLAVLLLLSCNPRERKINPEDIKGKWYLNQWTTFLRLEVGDSTIFVDNHVDTIFTVRYSISHDTLITYAPFTNQQFKNRIILLTKDTLVLDGIMDVKEERHYSRSTLVNKKTARIQADSIKVLADDSTIKVFADYNLSSTFHDDQKKRFDYWNYDSTYYLQRISAQNQNRKRGKLFVPGVLKGIWIPVYSYASTFYVQKDCDAQQRFSINDSTFNFFDGMMVVEPYVMDKIKMELGDFEITTRASKKIELTKVDDERLIFKVAMEHDRCFYVTRLSDINKFPILVVECKIGAVSLEEEIKLDEVNCK